MICSWCRVEYTGTPIYHICPDGMTFDKRREKSSEELVAEYDRQDAAKKTNLNRRKSDRPTGYMVMNWTPEDMAWLIGMRIDPIGDDYDKD